MTTTCTSHLDLQAAELQRIADQIRQTSGDSADAHVLPPSSPVRRTCMLVLTVPGSDLDDEPAATMRAEFNEWGGLNYRITGETWAEAGSCGNMACHLLAEIGRHVPGNHALMLTYDAEDKCDGCPDGCGVIYTEPHDENRLQQGEADHIEPCDVCRQFEDGIVAARHLAGILLPRADDEYTALPDNRVYGFVVSAHDRRGHLPELSNSVALRLDMPEACMWGDEHAPRGGYFRVEMVSSERPPEPAPEADEVDPVNPMHAAMFDVLVSAATAYVEAVGGVANDGVRTMMQGLVEVMADRYGAEHCG